VESPNPFTVVAPNVVKSTGHYFQVMAQSAIDKIPPGPKLDALTAEKIFGWKNIQAQSFAGEVSPKLSRMRYFTAAKVCSTLLGSFEIPAKSPARALSA
jgi:hypothetical protein